MKNACRITKRLPNLKIPRGNYIIARVDCRRPFLPGFELRRARTALFGPSATASHLRARNCPVTTREQYRCGLIRDLCSRDAVLSCFNRYTYILRSGWFLVVLNCAFVVPLGYDSEGGQCLKSGKIFHSDLVLFCSEATPIATSKFAISF